MEDPWANSLFFWRVQTRAYKNIFFDIEKSPRKSHIYVRVSSFYFLLFFFCIWNLFEIYFLEKCTVFPPYIRATLA